MGKYRSEWKYSISISHATQIRERLEAVLERDVHAKENGKYEIHSMYFDDFQNTCARENVAGDGIRYKYRIRYYTREYFSKILLGHTNKKFRSIKFFIWKRY